jgi:hypothetical protein
LSSRSIIACAAVGGRELKGCHTFSRPRRDPRTSANQLVGHVEIVALGGPMERRAAVDLRGIDVRLTRQRCAHRVAIATLGRIGDIRGRRIRHTCSDNEQ